MTKATSLGIVPKNNDELSRVVVTLCLGVCDAIAAGAMSIEDAERHLFNPYTLRELQRCGLGPEVTDLVHLGTELSDVQRLIPTKLSQSIEQIRAMALAVLAACRPSSAEWIAWLEPVRGV